MTPIASFTSTVFDYKPAAGWVGKLLLKDCSVCLCWNRCVCSTPFLSKIRVIDVISLSSLRCREICDVKVMSQLPYPNCVIRQGLFLVHLKTDVPYRLLCVNGSLRIWNFKCTSCKRCLLLVAVNKITLNLNTVNKNWLVLRRKGSFYASRTHLPWRKGERQCYVLNIYRLPCIFSA